MKDNITRREFLKTSVGMAVSVGFGLPLLAEEPKGKAYEIEGTTGMRYRLFGRTNQYISVIAGNETFPPPVIDKAIRIGVNYWHKARGRELSNLIRKHKVRKSVMVEFCLDNKPREELLRKFKNNMRRLGYDYVDFYKMHIRYSDEAVEAFQQLKKEGLVKFLSASLHESPKNVRRIVDKGVLDAIQIMINPLSGEEVKKLCAYCKEKGIGVIAMKTMVGGPKKWKSNRKLMERLKKFLPNTQDIARAIVKYVLSIEGVSAVVVACRNIEQFQDAVLASGMKLSSAERKGLEIFASEMRGEFCQMCGLCEEVCPKGIQIRELMRAELYLTTYEEPDRAWEVYSSIPPWRRAEMCDRCGICEESCPYGIPVVQRINELQSLIA